MRKDLTKEDVKKALVHGVIEESIEYIPKNKTINFIKKYYGDWEKSSMSFFNKIHDHLTNDVNIIDDNYKAGWVIDDKHMLYSIRFNTEQIYKTSKIKIEKYKVK